MNCIGLGAAVKWYSTNTIHLNVVHFHNVGRDGILRLNDALLNYIVGFTCTRVAYLEVQVRALRRTRISRSGDLLASLYRKLTSLAVEINAALLESMTLGLDILGNIAAKTR